MANFLWALRGKVCSSVPSNPHSEGSAPLPVLCSEDTGAGCWFCYPAKELEWIQTLVSWQGRVTAGWPWQREGGLKDEQDCSSVLFPYATVLER